MISVVLLLVAFSVDWAKTYKPVNYKYTAFGNKEFRGYGCPKGSFGYYNTSGGGDVSGQGTEWKGDHTEQSKCEECKTITEDFVIAYFTERFSYLNPSNWDLVGGSVTVNNTEMEKACNGQKQVNVLFRYTVLSTGPFDSSRSFSIYHSGCFWNSKKKTCGATSCPYAAAIQNCNGNWTDGKCKKSKGNTCLAYEHINQLPSTTSPSTYNNDIYEPWPSGCGAAPSGSGGYREVPDDISPPPGCGGTGEGKWIPCDKLGDFYKKVDDDPATSTVKYVKFTKEDVKTCNWHCTHDSTFGPYYPPYQTTIQSRKACHKVYGCLYSDWYSQSCSYWAIWAFILFLVLLILFVIAIIVVIVILVIKLCGKKTTKVEDGAAAQSKSASPAAAPVDSSPPPPSGPYVVIKLGKQEKQTKKVQSSQWGESIVFTGLGAEDDDVEIELHADSGALLGNVNIRIPEYVNAKKRATLTLKSGDADIGVLETDIEIQVQEEPEVKITGVFYVDKFTKA